MFKTRTKDPKWWYSLRWYHSNKNFTKRLKLLPATRFFDLASKEKQPVFSNLLALIMNLKKGPWSIYASVHKMYRTSTYSQANTLSLHISYLFLTKSCPIGGTRQSLLSNCKITCYLSGCLDSKYLVLKHLGKVKKKILGLFIKCQLGECFLKNIMVSSYQEFKGNNMGEDISFHSHRDCSLPHTLYRRD